MCKNGKGEVDASVLALLAHILKKPFGYFYPPNLYQEIKQEDLSPLENELVILFRQIVDATLQEVVIKQVKAMGEFGPKDLVINMASEISSRLQLEKEDKESYENRVKKKLEFIRLFQSNQIKTPNEFTIQMGQLIKKVKEDEGMSQAELAKNTNRKSAIISDIENGNSEIGVLTLVLFTIELNKTIIYFFRNHYLKLLFQT